MTLVDTQQDNEDKDKLFKAVYDLKQQAELHHQKAQRQKRASTGLL